MRTRAQRHRPHGRGDAVTRTVFAATVALTLFVTISFLFGAASGGRSSARAATSAIRAKSPERLTTTRLPTDELPGR
jgi:hypothetical protein